MRRPGVRATGFLGIWFLLVLLVSACTGGGEVAESPALLGLPRSDDPVRILALGDSYTIGESVDKLEDWPTQLVRGLRILGVGVAEPVVIARTGWTAHDLLVAIDDADLAAGTNMLNPELPYDIVTLQIGVNNQFRSGSIDDFEGDLERLTELAIGFAGGEAHHVFLLSIPDWGVTPFARGAPTEEIAASIDRFNDVIRDRARASSARFFDITGISRRAVDEPDLVAVDGLHPSALMYAEWVELMLPKVREVLR